MILLIDIGNTRIKAVVNDPVQNTWLELPTFIHTEKALEFAEVWREWLTCLPKDHKMEAIGIATVNEKVFLALEQARPEKGGTPLVLATSQASFERLVNSYSKPQNMGVDRWLAMVAASNAGQRGALVVDAGTALTVDAVNSEGLHLGGYILPGLNRQLHALLEGTERVFAGDLRQAKSLLPGKDTPECVLNGLLAQSTSFITAQAKWAKEQGIQRLVISGGESNLLISHLKRSVGALGMALEQRPRLVFEGLLTITLNQVKKS